MAEPEDTMKSADEMKEIVNDDGEEAAAAAATKDDDDNQETTETTTIEQDVVAENEEREGQDAGKKKRKRRKVETTPPAVETHYSKRARKSAESFQPENFAAPKETVTIIKGRGTKLRDIPNVKESIQSYNYNSEEVVAAHKILFRGNVGKAESRHKVEHLLEFSGYLPATTEGQDEDERDKQDEKLETKMSQKAYKLVVRELKMLCDLFDVDRSPSTIDKDELVDRLLDFLSKPSVKLTKAGGGGSGSADASSSKKKSTPKKKKGKKKKQQQEETEEEEEESEEEEDSDDEEQTDDFPSDKALKKWVKAYVACFNMDNVTVNHALTTASDKFGVDLKEKKGVLKKMLTELM